MTKEEAIKYLQQLYPNGGHCMLDEQRIEAIGMAVKALQEEHVSEELEEASKEWLRPQLDKSYAAYGETKQMELTHFDGYAMLDAIEFGAKWKEQQMMAKVVDSEKDLELSWEDMRELYIIFAKVDTEIELCKTDIETETLGYYQEVLKRFKDYKERKEK